MPPSPSRHFRVNDRTCLRCEVRVIMGSTQTLGTGVNIQGRLHLLVHMDAPYRPIDYTQRNGCILRQGNLHRDWGLPVRIVLFGVDDLTAKMKDELDEKEKKYEGVKASLDINGIVVDEEDADQEASFMIAPEPKAAGGLGESGSLATDAVKEMLKGSGAKVTLLREEVNPESKSSPLKTHDGVVYGYAKDGGIYLNRDRMNPETPVHEYTHLWFAALKESNPELRERGIGLMKQMLIWNEVTSDESYSYLSADGDIASECLSRLVGKKRAVRLDGIAKSVLNDRNVVESARKLTVIDRFGNWLKEFWTWVKDSFSPRSREDAEKATIEDIENMTLSDLARGVNPDERRATEEIRQIALRAKADGTYMKAPNGEASNLTAEQWAQVRTKAFKNWSGD